MDYDERFLEFGDTCKSVRYYREARAKIHVGKNVIEPQLRDENRIIVAQTDGDASTLSCPTGPLSAEQLELIDVPGNTCMLPLLRPADTNKVGEQWEPSRRWLAHLFGLDAVTEADVTATLHQIREDDAIIKISGIVHGAAGGVSTEIRLSGQLLADKASTQIRGLDLEFSEKRSIGHAEPGFEVDATLHVESSPLAESPHLSDSALADLSLNGESNQSLLQFESPNGQIRFLHERNWRQMVDRADLTILRLVDRGDLVAQCNVSKLTNLPAGKSVNLQEFQADVRRALGDNFGQFVEATQATSASGLRVLRIVVVGTVSNLPIQWIYYHLSSDNGRRASLVFTMDGNMVEQFAAADDVIVSSFHFQEPPADEVPSPAAL